MDKELIYVDRRKVKKYNWFVLWSRTFRSNKKMSSNCYVFSAVDYKSIRSYALIYDLLQKR